MWQKGDYVLEQENAEFRWYVITLKSHSTYSVKWWDSGQSVRDGGKFKWYDSQTLITDIFREPSRSSELREPSKGAPNET